MPSNSGRRGTTSPPWPRPGQRATLRLQYDVPGRFAVWLRKVGAQPSRSHGAERICAPRPSPSDATVCCNCCASSNDFPASAGVKMKASAPVLLQAWAMPRGIGGRRALSGEDKGRIVAESFAAGANDPLGWNIIASKSRFGGLGKPLAEPRLETSSRRSTTGSARSFQGKRFFSRKRGPGQDAGPSPGARICVCYR